MTEEPLRRLRALVNADIVGYSRLMSQNEDAAVSGVNRARERVEALASEHHGRLVDFSGDNFLAEFESATDSVRFGLAVQTGSVEAQSEVSEELHIRFRMGMHLGEVRLDGGRVYGDGVNIAARLEPLADPGGICVSGVIVAQLRNKLDVGFEDMGHRKLKNIPEPVSTYRVVAPGLPIGGKPPPLGLPRWIPGAAVGLGLAALIAIGMALLSQSRDPELPPPSGAPIEVDAFYGQAGAAPDTPLRADAVLESGDKFRIDLRIAEQRWVYVFQLDPAGNIFLLFPLTEMAGVPEYQNPLPAGQAFELPGPGKSYRLDSTTGEEDLYVLSSPSRNFELEAFYTELERYRREEGRGQERPAAAAAETDTFAAFRAEQQRRYSTLDHPIGVDWSSYGARFQEIVQGLEMRCPNCVRRIRFEHR